MPQERVAVLLPQLVGLGIVRRRETAQGPWYGLIPVEELLAKAALAAEDPDVFEMEANLLRRVVEGFGTPGLTVISSSEDRDPARRIPEITKYADTLMPYIDLRLGTRCNLNCTYCLLGHENRTTRTTAEIVSDLMLGRRRNLQKVALTGGEPTLHPEVLKIITVAGLWLSPGHLGYKRGNAVNSRGFRPSC